MSQAPHDPTRPAPAAWQPQAPGNAPRALSILGVVLGLLGLIVGVAAWLRAAPSRDAAEPMYSEQQVADAKRAVCDAYERGVRSMAIAGKRRAKSPADAFPIAINTRLAEVAVANYLLNAILANPATPQDLQDSASELAKAYQDIAITQLADGTTADSEPFGLSADEAIERLEIACR